MAELAGVALGLIEKSIPAYIIRRIEHGNNILRRHVGLDVVYLIEDISAAGREELHPFLHMGAHFVRRRCRQHTLRVAAPAPEYDLVAEFLFQTRRLHIGGGGLHWIEDIDAGLNEMRDQVIHRSAAMQEGLHLCILMNPAA